MNSSINGRNRASPNIALLGELEGWEHIAAARARELAYFASDDFSADLQQAGVQLA